MAELRTETMTVNMGPQHPSTHGVLRLVLELDGEVIQSLMPTIGYLHTGIEKTAEQKKWQQVIPLVERMDYLGAQSNSLAYALAVEKLLGLEMPARVNDIRILIAELQRIASHLIWLGTHGMEIGAGAVVLGLAGRTDPVDRTAARIAFADARCGTVAPAKARDGEAADLVPGTIRHVDVEDRVGRQRIDEQPLHEHERGLRGGLVVHGLMVVAGQRHGDRRQAEEAPFHRRRDRAGIDDIVAEVRRVVDAGHHDVGLEVEQSGQREMDAVGRRARDAVAAVVHAGDADGLVERQRIAGARAVAIWRDDGDAADDSQTFGQYAYAGRVDAVVVGNQNSHAVGPRKQAESLADSLRSDLPMT